MIIKKYGNYAPQLHPSVRVAENAAIVGNETMEKDVSVWYSAVVRGDHRDLHLSIRRQRQMCMRDRCRCAC